MSNEQSVKCPRNTPPGVGADSSRPYPYIIKNVYFHNQICVSTLSNMRFRSPFRGYIHIRGHDKSAPTAADGLPIMLRTFHNNATHTLLFWGKYKKGPHKWNPFNCKPSAITIANRLQQCHKRPRSIVFYKTQEPKAHCGFSKNVL